MVLVGSRISPGFGGSTTVGGSTIPSGSTTAGPSVEWQSVATSVDIGTGDTSSICKVNISLFYLEHKLLHVESILWVDKGVCLFTSAVYTYILD